MMDQQQSRLMRVPPELRNHIYELVFKDSLVPVNGFGSIMKRGSPAYSAPGILLACHQTYNEAINTFYAETIFVAHYGFQLDHWIKRLPKRVVSLLNHVRLDLAWCDPGYKTDVFEEQSLGTASKNLQRYGFKCQEKSMGRRTLKFDLSRG